MRITQAQHIILIALPLALTTLAALVFSMLPPFPAVRGSQPLPILTPLSYQITIFIPFGILLAEILIELLQRAGSLYKYVVVIGALSSIALFRLLFFIPVSGHCLLLGYYLPRQAITYQRRYPVRLLIGILVFLHIAYYKVHIWQDPITPFTGLGIGFFLWIVSEPVYHYFRPYQVKDA